MLKYRKTAAFILMLGLFQIVLSQPQIRLDPEQLDLHAVWYPGEWEWGNWEVYQGSFSIYNDGDEVLQVTSIESDVEWLVAASGEFEIAPDGNHSVRFDIECEPEENPEFDEYDITVTISSNDPDNEEIELPVHAVLEIFPLIFDFQNIDVELYIGQEEQWEFSMENVGDEDIGFQFEIELISEPDQNQQHPQVGIDPQEGVLEPEDEIEVIITANAEDCEEGDYELNIYLSTNIPYCGEFEFRVILRVTAAPDIDVEWSEDYGYPDVVDWNLGYHDFFLGGPYEMVVEVFNRGSDDLVIDEIYCEHEYFTAEPNELFLEPDESAEVIFIFDADEVLDILVYGDDPDTNEVEGFQNGEAMYFMVWDNEQRREYFARVEFIEGPEVWVNTGESVIAIDVFWSPPRIPFSQGWNLISLNVVPVENYWDNYEEGPNMVLMLEEFRDDEGEMILDIIKDERGDFCAPLRGYYAIDYWNLEESYLIKVRDDIDVFWLGAPIHPQTELSLEAGWNMVAYYPYYDLPADEESDFYVLSSIIDHVLIAKDGQGRFMAPRFGYSNMPPWTPCQGYQVYVDEDLVLVYPVEYEERQGAVAVTGSKVTEHWPAPVATASNMRLLVLAEPPLLWQGGSKGGYEIGVYTNNQLVGSGVLHDGVCGIAVWGDDPSTVAIDGALEGQPFEIRLLTGEGGHSCPPPYNSESAVDYTLLSGEAVYATDGFAVVELSASATVPDEFGINSVYPNPFNSSTTIRYGLGKPAPTRLALYDLSGREVRTLYEGNRQAGFHSVNLNANDLSSGVYFVRLEASGQTISRKVLLIR